MKTMLIVASVLIALAICPFILRTSNGALPANSPATWEYATAANLELGAIESSQASWKAPGVAAVVVDAKNSEGNALYLLDAKLLGKQPPKEFAACAVAGLLTYTSSQGWELVSVSTSQTASGQEMLFIFKRPVR